MYPDKDGSGLFSKDVMAFSLHRNFYEHFIECGFLQENLRRSFVFGENQGYSSPNGHKTSFRN
jgi:hypothetical protein